MLKAAAMTWMALPGMRLLRTYRRDWLPKDVVAGLVLTSLLVPQGMAYASLAGLPPITGLYTSILCLVAYALFGPSRILVLGPDSALGPMIAAATLPLLAAGGDPVRAVALASVLALMVGAALILIGVARLGFVADLLSKPTQVGYLNGLALTILIGQLPKLFGFSIDGGGLFQEVAGFVDGLRAGEAVPAAVAIGLGSLAVLLVFGRLMPSLPGVLIVVVGAIVVSIVADLGARGVSLVGALPQGFPPFTIPRIELTDLPVLAAGALGITLVSMTDTISISASFNARAGREVRPNREMIGIGTANIAAGLFQGFPVSTSGSRTAVAEQAGSKSQVTGLVGAAAITVMLVLVPGLLQDLPQPTLAAVVIGASLSIADIPGVVRLWRLSRPDFALAVAAFVGVALLGVLPGIALAVVLSILNVFRRVWWPYKTELGHVRGLKGYHSLDDYPDAERAEGLAIFRFDAPLFFANARAFRDGILDLADSDPPPRWILVAAEPITDVDPTAADILAELEQRLQAQGTSLRFAELKSRVRAKVERYEVGELFGPERFYPTVGSAVDAYRDEYGVRWKWEHHPAPPAEP